MSPNPSDLIVIVAAKSFGSYNAEMGWHFADEIRGRLKLFGFDPSPQRVAAALTRMCEEDTPRFERRKSPWGDRQYRVTQWGRNEINNKLPGLER